jgi:MFS family permease
VLRADRKLVLFTVGGILSMVVYGPLLTYLSQYLVITRSPEAAYRTASFVSAANAAVVISLQYVVGSRIKKEHLLTWLTWGMGAFALGLFGLSLSTALPLWVIAIVVFTLGEIIIVPAEYMVIDALAPPRLRGSYFGVQNLIYLGVAIGPILCGLLLGHLQASVMFHALIAVTMLSWLFYFQGCRGAVR